MAKTMATIVVWFCVSFCQPVRGGTLCVDAGTSPPPLRLYVDADATGANTGVTWADAFTDLHDALTTAAASGGIVTEIWVAAGTYRPSQGPDPNDHRTATFQLINGVALYGGFVGGETSLDDRDPVANKTILSGDRSANDVGDPYDPSKNDNCYHVVTGSGTDASAALDGFTITAGKAYGRGEDDHGAGLYNVSGSPTLRQCTFIRNWSASHGGGVYNISGNPTLTNCTFIGNTSGFNGGAGIYNSGSPTLTRCRFHENEALYGSGGGMHNDSDSSPMLINCTFMGNIAGHEGYYCAYCGGGGVYNHTCNPLLVNCVFSGNATVNNRGGGMRNYKSTPTLINCTFSGNSSSNNHGGGIYNESSIPNLINCILWGNEDVEGIDESAQIHSDGEMPVVNHSCIQGWTGTIGGIANIADDPLFMDPDGADFLIGTADDSLRLCPESPCADAGDNSAVPASVVVDLDGDKRITNDTVDMGAYEGPKQGFLLSTKSIIVPEGGTARFTVALAMDPRAPVQVIVYHNSGDADISVESGESLSFDSSNFPDPQTVTLAAKEDWDSFSGSAQICVSAPGFASDGVVAAEGDNEPGPTVLYVDIGHGDDGNDGLTKQTAFRTIQKAIDTAQKDGDVVLVADGEYPSEGENDPIVDFRGKAITVRSENGPENCILSEGDYVVYFHSGETHESVLSGFTITGSDPGAGICCYDSSPTIINNIIIDNASEYSLGAIWLHNSSAIVVGNVIAQNVDYSSRTAGIYCCHSSSPIIVNNTIADNSDWESDGGVYCEEGCTPTIANCIFWGNGDYDLHGCSATYSCLEHEPDTGPGTGNIYGKDPLFVDHEEDNYRLLPDSPCIDAGDNSAVLPSLLADLDGNPRVSHGIVDMGAYEYYISRVQFGLTGDQATLTWSSRAGATYSVFHSHDLLSWQLADGNVPSAGDTTTSWTDDGSRTGMPLSRVTRRFYRVIENR